MTAIVTKIPALRFPEFEGEWVKLKIKDVGQIRSGSTPLRSKKQYFQDGLISWVKTTDLNNSYIYQTEENVTQRALKETSLKLFAPGSVLVAMYGGFNQIGRTGLLKVEAATNQALSVISVNELVIPEYLLSWFNAKVRLWKRFAGSSRKDPNITGSDVANFPVWLPPKVEQQKIVAFLTTIDTRIQQLSRKKALLEQYKKGVMQQIFAQEIRFKDEEGKEFPAWEEKRLGDIATFFSGGTPSTTKKSYYSGDIPFIKSGEINSDQTEQFLSEEGLKNSSAKMIEKGDLLYALYGATSGEVGIARISGAINQAVLCIKTKQETSFLFFFLSFMKSRIVKTYLQGGQGNLSAQIVKSLKVPLPSLPEQQKIAAFLSTIDRQINLATQQLERMQAFKKGLLQQLFV